ncbi:MAG: GNAT family protein [Candidatus Izemoplasmatales bacterium]
MYQLRELTRNDIVEINQWRQSRELIEHLAAPYRYINIDVDNLWYEDYLKKRESSIRCIVLCDSEPVGLVSLLNIDRINQSAELHIMIGKQENRSHGAGTYAMTEMLRHAFMDINLNRVYLYVINTNLNAYQFYQKFGFINEGELRQSVYKNSSFQNQHIMSILKKDYLENNNPRLV